ncbi:hypothetical protein ILUMI_07321 [Ignelater luminosus]|uniref:Proteasome assembly chaperone 1 n=1 Tax=Ignelater luminosus TaxID=2038154 RepID=A0A8K0D915_IGNLU|nr:hypothetical protein ILUMI_07321 [Ignelater luminosus]
MVFGEIIEPSSRALWEDDFVDYLEDDEQQLQISGNFEVPDKIDKFFIGETGNIISILQKCVLQNTAPICNMVGSGATLYKINHTSYALVYKPQTNVAVGKITEELIPWLNAASNIYVLTSSTLTSLQNSNLNETSPCIIKFLSSKKEKSELYSRLEVPNLVTNLSASILSYSIHKGLTCSLYVGFLEDAPLDSLNTRPLLDLLCNLGINSIKGYVLEDKLPLNNLYM